jgi:sugar transferase (PEP-CTERM system associated)
MITVLLRWLRGRSLLLISAEHSLIVFAVVLSARIRLGDEDAWQVFTERHGFAKAILIAAACQLCFYYSDLYDVRSIGDRRELFNRIVQALGGASLLLAIVYFLLPSLIVGRGVFIIAAFFVITLLVGWRLAFEWLANRMAPRERLLLVGTGAAAVTLARELYERRQELGVSIVGFVDPDPAKVGTPVLNPGVIGTIDDIPSIIHEHSVDRVGVSLSDARGKLPMDRLLEMKMQGVAFDHLASVYEDYTGKIAVENLRPSWLIFSPGFHKTRLLLAAKRALDIAAAAIGLLLAAPLMALVALAVKLTSPGPVLYHQKRVGRDDRVFTLHKFRSMRADAEAQSGAVWATDKDPRLTPVGGALRKLRLDELPQLWNVLKGDMSLVGPRPERPEFIARLTEQIPFYRRRHVVKPGLTGWAQVQYPYGSTVEDAMEKLQYDLFYVKHMSIGLDLFIALKTIKTILTRAGL